MAWLKKAVASGYYHRAKIKNDRDLEVLRRRDDFQKLMNTQPKSLEPATGPKSEH